MAQLVSLAESVVRVQAEIGGRTLMLETGVIGKQAGGAVMAHYAGTTVLATVVRAKPREGIDFFPLTVDYREKTSAAGKFPGGFKKREGPPSEKEILTMRMIDRPMTARSTWSTPPSRSSTTAISTSCSPVTPTAST